MLNEREARQALHNLISNQMHYGFTPREALRLALLPVEQLDARQKRAADYALRAVGSSDIAGVVFMSDIHIVIDIAECESCTADAVASYHDTTQRHTFLVCAPCRDALRVTQNQHDLSLRVV